MKTLEQIIREHYGVKRVFRKRDGEFTAAGARAYGKLTELIYDVATLTRSLDEGNDMIETLDSIVRGDFY